jgi:DNA-binding MarR family transcriptional regulator
VPGCRRFPDDRGQQAARFGYRRGARPSLRRGGLDRNEVSGIAGRLEHGQYIGRHVDPGNRRRNVLTLTASGMRYLEDIQRHADAAQDDLLVGLNAAGRRQLNELLAKVLSGHRPQTT